MIQKLSVLVLLLTWLVLAVGCSASSSSSSPEGEAGAYALSDSVKVNNVTYLSTNYGDEDYWPPTSAGIQNVKGRPLGEQDLGEKYAEVRSETDGNRTSDGRPGNAPATSHAPGTRVYKVEGYSPFFRLAVRDGKQLVLYEPVQNPRAKKGSDFLDINDKVSYIGLTFQREGAKEITLAREPQKVRSLIQGLMEAPLERRESDYFYKPANGALVIFHLRDGTAVVREYRSDSGLLSPGIKAPKNFQVAVEQVL